MLFLIFYNVFAVPVAIAFQLEVPPTHPWFWAELLFDVVFLIDVVLNFMFDAWLFSRHVGTLSISGATLICSGIGFLALSKAAKPSAQEEDAKKSASCIKSSSELLPADTA